jgi:ABC-type transporter Mla subunit MlaD
VDPLKHQRWIGAGVVALLGCVIALLLARENRKIGPGVTVWVEMSSAGPLVQGSKVRVAGLVVGQVEEVSFVRRQADEPAQVRLRLWISRRHKWLLHQNSEYFINQPALLSEPYLEVGIPKVGDPGPELQNGAVVHGVDPASIDQLLTRSYAAMRELGAMMHNEFPEIDELGREITAIEGTFKDLAQAPVWKGDSLTQLVVEATRTKTFLEQAVDESSHLPETVAQARALVTNGRAAIARLRGQVQALSERIDGLRGQLSPERLARLDAALARVDAFTRQIDETLASADALTAMIASGEGSLAAFAADMEIADEVKAVTKLLKEQPWRLGHPLDSDKKSGL